MYLFELFHNEEGKGKKNVKVKEIRIHQKCSSDIIITAPQNWGSVLFPLLPPHFFFCILIFFHVILEPTEN